MKEYILTLDQGTTSSRALAYDLNGEILAVSQKEITQYYPQPGWVEHDPEEILKSQINVARDVVEKTGGPDGMIAVAITNQRETTLIWNRDSGRALYRAIVWQCRRSSSICEELKKAGYEEEVRSRTGLVIDAYFSASKLMWLFREHPDLLSLAKSGRVAFGTVDSWLIYNLTGEHKTDYSNASRTMLFNINDLDWDNDLLKSFNIPDSILPQAQPSFSNFGNVKKDIFGKEVHLVGVIGDQQSSLLGQGCIREGMVKNTYGTGCFVLMNTGNKRCMSKRGLLATYAWGDESSSVYTLEGSVFIGGAVVQWLRDGLKIVSEASQTEKIAGEVKDSGGVYFVPAFVGLGAPYWRMDARGTITGITRGTTYKHIVRAALESIAYQSYDVIKTMEEDSGILVKELGADGGASANNFLMQFQSDILNKVIFRSEILESTSRGAFFSAAVGLGLLTVDRIEELVKISGKFYPTMDEDYRDTLLKGWRDAVKKTIA